ncbi:AAA domain-containing protein [Cereibacter azotoformans]|uniref:AAA domain-containing protein n=2 Tax=Cereibacter azotoformans TaxID=43057 RepID=A0A2T5JN53_9RHOB|nr:AAA domain-containing protein [Cereibacter azotoformans]
MNAVTGAIAPSLLQRMSLTSAQVAVDLPPQQYLDGLAIPMNAMSFLFTDGGSGKSTGSRKAGIEAAATGRFHFLGERVHDRPLRVVLVYGEETQENIIHSIQSIPGCKRHFLEAQEAGRLAVVSVQDFLLDMQSPERVFGENGMPTTFGKELFGSIADFKPDLFVLDTLTSLADTEYLDGISARNTVSFLNSFCSRTRCAGMGFGHLTKGIGAKLTEKVSPAELIASARGSAMLVNSARHFGVMVPAPKGVFENFNLDDPADQLWIGTFKTNLTGCDLAFKIFPAIRDASEKTISAVTEGGGGTIAARLDESDAVVMEELKLELPIIIRAAAELRSPFVQKSSSTYGVEELSCGALAGIIPTATKAQITRALNILETEGKIVPCTATRAGAGAVWDVPSGDFARQAEYEAGGEKLKFRPGAPDREAMAAKIDDIRTEEERIRR